jgi:hypothetical protein
MRQAAAVAKLEPDQASQQEFADERPTAQLAQRTKLALRAVLVGAPQVTRPRRFPKATAQRSAVDATAWDHEATQPQAVSPFLLEMCRDRAR